MIRVLLTFPDSNFYYRIQRFRLLRKKSRKLQMALRYQRKCQLWHFLDLVFVGTLCNNQHFQNRTSVGKYFNTGTVPEVTRFACKRNGFHLLLGPETSISTGNVTPFALFLNFCILGGHVGFCKRNWNPGKSMICIYRL